jgi:glycine/D-amino acid oxidase-like deaminating enzyme
VVGWAPGADRLYVVVTHSGMTLSLLLGELAANEITTGAEQPILGPFRPDRFGG